MEGEQMKTKDQSFCVMCVPMGIKLEDDIPGKCAGCGNFKHYRFKVKNLPVNAIRAHKKGKMK